MIILFTYLLRKSQKIGIKESFLYLLTLEIDDTAFPSSLTIQVASFAYLKPNDYSLKHLPRNGALALGWQEMLQDLLKMVDLQRNYSDPIREEVAQKKYLDILGTSEDVKEIKQRGEPAGKLLVVLVYH